MINIRRMGLLVTGTFLFLVFNSCQMGRSSFMTEEQQQKLETAYNSMQGDYMALMNRYEAASDSVPGELQNLYAQMQQMHREMDVNHRQMMNMGTGQQQMRGDHMMMGNGMGMGMQMQGHMTGEWYQQMMSMHERMAAIHNQLGERQMAGMHRKLSEDYGKMMDMVPGLDEPEEFTYNENGNPDLLNGKNLFSQNCASCHGNEATGIAGVFPPLENSKWVTGDKSVPIRILMNGLSGNIDVNSRPYTGTMPSFKARLSAAEVASILNYLRSLSDENLPKITQNDVIQVGRKYSSHTSPWRAEELREN